MGTALLVLTVLVAIFEIWWMLAYLAAYRQLQERLLLFQVWQGFAMAVLFSVFAWFIAVPEATTGLIGSLLLFLVVVLLIVSMWTNYIWRMRGGLKLLAQHYRRGLFDLLAFRRPAVDLKRRVRSK
ncbi:MAG: hypothetical protein MUD01_07430 [Chloroflexaceae bacterium]|nr:hypothetical protein [Chloroflexaceae bacterium]